MSAFNVYVGYDHREADAYHVCVRSMTRRAKVPLRIHSLIDEQLRATGMYWRTFAMEDGQKYDLGDRRPFSTEFSFTRWLVSALNGYSGWALFCDLDFLWRADVGELIAMADPSFAIMCVKHDHRPAEQTKMDDQMQVSYPRKNWSSMMLINCGHPRNAALTPELVNGRTGRWLQGMSWLDDDLIGEVPIEWNYLVGHNHRAQCAYPRAVHFTLGVPSMAGYENSEYADEWREELRWRTNQIG